MNEPRQSEDFGGIEGRVQTIGRNPGGKIVVGKESDKHPMDDG